MKIKELKEALSALGKETRVDLKLSREGIKELVKRLLSLRYMKAASHEFCNGGFQATIREQEAKIKRAMDWIRWAHARRIESEKLLADFHDTEKTLLYNLKLLRAQNSRIVRQLLDMAYVARHAEKLEPAETKLEETQCK